ncbi:MAG: hypothetical protein A3A85_09285 [Deltaproteobacteria bacterium RIFCSPLOWO2_01_FULL_42_9]|nr:MAG: hypothetical protein A3A85_09285 [Deltaproteobacteria bacterium RIFCSPLOWO2_01_FULL_42_9]
MGKASKRKQKYSEDKRIKQSDFVEEGSSSFLKRYSFLISLSLITITAFLIYSNTFASPFHFDDEPNIVENYKLRDLSNFWPPSGSRYVGVLSFALNYHFGGLNVFGYHLVNIIIHIINGLLIWWLIILTFKTPVMQVYVGQGLSPALTPDRIIRGLKADLPYLTALTASLIFVSHPIQTQAVTYIVQRFASLATLLYILSLTLYIKARLQTVQTGANAVGKFFSTSTLTFYFLSLVSAILAMKTKEISLTLPFVIILYEVMFFAPTKQNYGFAKRLLYLIPVTLTAFIIPLSLIGTDRPVGDMIGELREAAQETEEISRDVYLLTQFRVIVTYIRLLFLPINQNLDYDYPLSHSLFEPQTFAFFLFLSAIFAFAIYLFIRSRRTAKSPSRLAGEKTKSPSPHRGEGRGEGKCYGLLISFGILWFFITLSVESSIIPIRDVINEHRLYLPSVGAVIAFGSGVLYGFSYARERLGIKVSLLLATCVLLFVTAFTLGIATYKRNLVWKDDIALWDDVIEKSPEKARGYNNLGKALQEKELFTESIKALQQAIQLKPNLPEPHTNLGNVYSKQGRFDYAIKEYRAALKLNPYDAEAYNNLGNTYYSQGLFNEAMQAYVIAVKLKPDYPDAYNNLGSLYATQERIDAAIEEFKKALRLEPAIAETHNNLGNAYSEQGRIDEAIKEYRIALKLKPDYAKAHYNLGLTYKKKGLKDEAIREFKEALKIQPDYVEARKVLESLLKY